MKIPTYAPMLIAVLALVNFAKAADTYKPDPVHSTVIFRAEHGNFGHVWGRFNDPSGSFSPNEEDPTKSTFTIEIEVANVDTHNEKRDGHLKSPDFFNAKQYPTIVFKSTSAKKGEGKMLEVTGDLTMHGVTKSMTVPVELIGKGEFPPGTTRFGLEANFSVKKSDFKIKGVPGVGDEIKLIVAIEGVKS